jgi:WD40 repeat protein
MAFSPDAKFLATGSRDKTIKLWDALSGKELRQLKGHSSNVFGVSWSGDGAYLASAGRDKLVKIWNPHTGECLITLTGHADNARSVEFVRSAPVPLFFL